MKQWGLLAAVAAMLGMATTIVAGDVPSIKDIMAKAHKGGTALVPTVGKQLKAATPEWEAITKEAKELVTLGEALGKNKPSKGEEASWKKLTDEYVANAKELAAAAEKKDKEAAIAAQGKLAKSCGGCHKSHK